MVDGPLRSQNQKGRLLSRQKYERPAGQAPAGFLLTPCGLHNSQFDPGSIYLTPLWHEADPTFLGWGHCIKIRVIRHKSTLILIESGYFSFCQKLHYFWAFSRFKADPGSSRDRPFCFSMDFSASRSKMSSLDYRRVRWIIGAVRWNIERFVGF